MKEAIKCQKCDKIIHRIEEVETSKITKVLKWSWYRRKYVDTLEKSVDKKVWVYCRHCKNKKLV